MMTQESKPRVLMLSTSYPVSEGSLSGLFVQSLAGALRKSTVVSVVAPDDSFGETVKTDGLSVVKFRYAPKSMQLLAHSPGGVPAQLRRNKFYYLVLPVFIVSYLFSALRKARSIDLVQANWAFSSIVGFVVKKLFRIPLVTTLRGEDVRPTNGLVSQLLLRFSLWASDAVVVVSEEMRTILLKQYPECADKCVAIMNGVSELFHLAEKPSPIDCSEPLKLVFVGSLIPRKNVAQILTALKCVHDSGVDFIFTVVGDGSELSSLQSLVAELSLGDRVRFLGAVSPLEVASYLGAADVYVSASLHEGRPNSVLEAMSAGCCCVLSDIPGHRELVEGGLVVYFLWMVPCRW